MIQQTVMGANWGIAEGSAAPEQGDGPEQTVRVIVFVDPNSGQQFHFPLILEQAKKLAEQLGCDDLQEYLEAERKRADLTAVTGDAPSAEQLAQMAKAARGDPAGIPILQRGKPMGSQ